MEQRQLTRKGSAMSKRLARASLSKGRSGWCVIYYHPVVRGENGKAKRVRRGLRTTDEARAQTLVDQVNALIEDPSMHTPGSRERAATRFDEEAVAAFYVPMQPSPHNPWAVRDEVIPLPGGRDADDGYARVQFVGTTGAGKTTVVRQLLGTDPNKERFPLTSTGRATTADMEIVISPGDFRAVVTFMPRDQVRQYVAESLQAAVASVLAGDQERDVIRRLQEHNDLRFRLKYILGDLLALRATMDRPTNDEEDDEDDADDETDSGMSQEEKADLRTQLEDYLRRIGQIAEAARAQVAVYANDFGVDLSKATRDDQDVLQELVEDWLMDNEDFHDLVDAVFEDVESRFDRLDPTLGEVARGRDNWPAKWTCKIADRSVFLKTVNRFSSNYAPNFGRLLTPLVDGIRVAGPFAPNWYADGKPRLVLMDGQGIGHTADSSSSVSTSITGRFRITDAIVLVDNAEQAMQAAPCAVLKAVVEAGYESKLIVAFTHFDAVAADNLVGRPARKDHVLGAFENAVHEVAKTLGREAESALRRLIPERIVFLAGIQARLDPAARGDVKFCIAELHRLLKGIAKTTAPTGPITFTPFYHVANLVLAIQSATESFRTVEEKIIRSEHWTRVKALTRRLGEYANEDAYDTLQPVADLKGQLLTALYKFLSEPVAWQPSTPAEGSLERDAVIARIRQEIDTRLANLARKRVKDERIPQWQAACLRRGRGSGTARKDDVVTQYEGAAPTPTNDVWAVVLRGARAPQSEDVRFLLDVCNIIGESVQAGGGVLRGWSRADDKKEEA